MWDSGLRPIPSHILSSVREALAVRATQRELLPLARLAADLGVHVRTLQAAARTRAASDTFQRTIGVRPPHALCLARRRPNSSWRDTTDDSAGRRNVRLPTVRA